VREAKLEKALKQVDAKIFVYILKPLDFPMILMFLSPFDYLLKTIPPDLSTTIKQCLQLVNVPEDENDSIDDFNIIKEQFELNDMNILEEKDEAIKCNLKSLKEILEQLNIDQISRELLITGRKSIVLLVLKLIY
jgi:hypothetical protein